jgi:hypothetical protein
MGEATGSKPSKGLIFICKMVRVLGGKDVGVRVLGGKSIRDKSIRG